jgi:hypothetical protein
MGILGKGALLLRFKGRDNRSFCGIAVAYRPEFLPCQRPVAIELELAELKDRKQVTCGVAFR